MSTFNHGSNPTPKNGDGKPVVINSYDTAAPPNLISFMLTGWKPTRRDFKVTPYAKDHRRRREELSKRFPGEALIIPSGHPKVRSNDTFFRFRPGSDFFYLTGCMEADCVLVMVPDKIDSHKDILFVDHNPGKTTAQFFTDRNKGELWEGPLLLGVPESQKKYGMTEAKPLTELESTIKALLTAHPRGCRIVRGFSEPTEKLFHHDSSDQLERDRQLTQFLHDMRITKDAGEIKELTLAINSTKRGFEDVIGRFRKARTERELEGAFYTRARMEGNDVGYYSIVASGAHACVLHWKNNDGKLNKGDLLLLDAGVEGHSLYTADITRTLPLSGTFSKAQREIYELVLEAQRAGMKAVKPGNDFMYPNQCAMEVLAQGLYDLKIMKQTPVEALKQENQFYKRYSLHNVSHMLGIDVHDCAKARAENYKYGKLRAGMVLTMEPGLYFQPDDLTVPSKYRGIGIRIEDDVLVTEKGVKNLSASIPTEVNDVEKWIKEIWKRA